jgi:uncharacterized membrane protein
MEKEKNIKLNEADSIRKLASTRHSRNINELHEENLTFGDRIADKLADVAGSWKFIISFSSILFIWILLNSIRTILNPFDPFPYILLNLVLSCVAALQAPIIMMSQNRQETKDRIRAEHDYEVNLKAEILIEDIIYSLNRVEENKDKVINMLWELKNERHDDV